MPENRTIEHHPLPPFLPEGAKVLMLGSFPPPRSRWAMEFFYPNIQNDMWRIMGLVFFGRRDHFVEGKSFDRERIVAFCTATGIALSDTAQAVVRHGGNASDALLEVVERLDLAALLARIPLCHNIVTTGQKATDTLMEIIGGTQPVPQTGGSTKVSFAGRELTLWRMPSSSRAYPLPLERKAEAYRQMFLVVSNQ